jgi:hypothetical protein
MNSPRHKIALLQNSIFLYFFTVICCSKIHRGRIVAFPLQKLLRENVTLLCSRTRFVCIHSMPTSSLRNAYICLWTCLLSISGRYECYKLYELGCSFLSITDFSCLVSNVSYLLALECSTCCITCHVSDIPLEI